MKNVAKELVHKVEEGIIGKEFSLRVENLLRKPSEATFSDLANAVRTFEAMERTRLARIRTWLSIAVVSLGALGLAFIVLRLYLLD